MASLFLPGLPREYVLERLKKAGGNEVDSGKLTNPQSSAALVANTFGWFHDQPGRLPPLPVQGLTDMRANAVEIEYCARFPWKGGRHPWLDAWVETTDILVGIESKRFEPIRDRKITNLSKAYDRPVWHDRMHPYEVLRDKLRSGNERFKLLDAVQLVKHAFGLVTEGRRKAKQPYLIYLFAEPKEYAGQVQKHRDEITRFADAAAGDEVGFNSISYRDWLSTWPEIDSELVAHCAAIIPQFRP